MKDFKVLVIDPDFDYLQLLSKFLSSDGFHVITASDGEEGLRKAMIESPDLILMEPMLSKLHGFTLCNIVSKEFKKKIPVIILTNHYQDAHHKKEAIQIYGAAAYLTRPIMKKELRSTVFDVLGKKSMDGMEGTSIPQEQVREAPKDEPSEHTSSHPVSEGASDNLDQVAIEVVEEDPAKAVADAAQENPADNQPQSLTEAPQEIEAEDKDQVPVTSTETPPKPSRNNGNGSNGKSKVDKMIDDIESEFGLITDKKAASNNHNLQL